MGNDAVHEQYVADTLARFDAFVMESVRACPSSAVTLTEADFRAARYELLKVLSAHRHKNAVDSAPPAAESDNGGDPDSGQYLPVTPAPWP